MVYSYCNMLEYPHDDHDQWIGLFGKMLTGKPHIEWENNDGFL